MKKNIELLFIVIGLLITSNIFAQSNMNNEEKPYIEIIGIAEQEVIPDEIYIDITIKEKLVNKEKITIESQEDQLKTVLKSIGININHLFLSDANTDFVKGIWFTKDLLTQKNYTLKVSSATQVGLVFQQLDKLEIKDASINKVNHSKIDSLRKEIKILAIKSAKNKADYLLAAIGEQTGKPLIIRENSNPPKTDYVRTRNREVNYSLSQSDGLDKSEEIQFNKIKIEASIYVKFSIKE